MGVWAVAAITGLIQGVIEWLPVSSKTMITLVYAAGGYSFGTGYVMGLLANFGSFFAALWYFRRDVVDALRALRHPFSADEDARLLRYVVLATIATGLVGLPIYAGVTAAFTLTGGAYAMVAIGVLLLVTSVISLQRERLAQTADVAAAADVGERGRAPGTWGSIVVGLCQGLAALPGISRSAVTVTPLLWMGRPAKTALRLSFLIDVLALIAAGAVPLVFGHHGLSDIHQIGVGPTVLMVVIAAVVSFFTIDVILSIASRLRSSVITGAIGILTIAAAAVLHLR